MDQKADLAQLFDILTHETVNSVAFRHGGTARDCELRGIVARTAILALEPRDGTEITMACRAVMYGSMSDDALALAGVAVTESSRARARKEAAALGRQQMACLKAIQSHRAEQVRRAKAAKTQSLDEADAGTTIPITIRVPAAEAPARAAKEPAPARAADRTGTWAEHAVPKGEIPEQNFPDRDPAERELMEA